MGRSVTRQTKYAHKSEQNEKFEDYFYEVAIILHTHTNVSVNGGRVGGVGVLK